MKITVLIPCHNEEKSIQACVQSCLDQTRPPDEIVVVNDGSTDASRKILEGFGKKIKLVNRFQTNSNKSYAQEAGLKHVTGDVFIATDGDTLLDEHFVERIEKDFHDENVAAVGGYVKSIRYNWMTACRAYDYAVGQNIHKQAQSILGFMLVIPGAAGAFRTEMFKKYLKFDHDTLTEDLDVTYRLHKYGRKILYDKKAIVYTQDPFTWHSYINQMRRWYGGGWQSLRKHLDGKLIDDPRRALELSLIYIEGLVFSVMLFALPVVSLIFMIKLLATYFAVLEVLAVYAALQERRIDLLFVPLYSWILMYVNSAIFLEQFVKEIIIHKSNLIWFHPEGFKLRSQQR